MDSKRLSASSASLCVVLKWNATERIACVLLLVLVAIILLARSALVSSGAVTIEINGEKTITVPAGGKLLQTLSEADLFLPSACGGGGSDGGIINNPGGGSGWQSGVFNDADTYFARCTAPRAGTNPANNPGL